jgi:Protein of unknown function (DUF3540)
MMMNYVNETNSAPQLNGIDKKRKPVPLKSTPTASPTPGEWCVGIVQSSGDAGLRISSGGFQARAQRAVSCLLEPTHGDSVACLRVAPDEVWIVAVLHREEGVSNVLSCTGNTSLQVHDGGLQIKANTLKLNSEHLHVASKDAHMATESAEIVGKQLRIIGTAIKVVGSVMSTVMDRVNHYSKHYLRTTEGVDRVSATHIECEAQQLMRLDAEHTLVSGAQLVKARGAQIHFG